MKTICSQDRAASYRRSLWPLLRRARIAYLFVMGCWLPDSIAEANVLVNGDFQTGSLSPSTSAYSFSSNMFPAATWNIVSSDTINANWVDFYDHTRGNSTGKFMVINGTTSGGGPSWAQSVAVTANTFYVFTAWVASLHPPSPPASLEFRAMNGASPLATRFILAPATTGLWFDRNMTIYTGATTSLSMQIWDTNNQGSGNDYALDDISLTAISDPGPLGDYNVNGVVDAADYVVWRKNEGTTNDLPNDNGLTGTIGQPHYDLWRAHFGATAGSGSMSGGEVVPEPDCLLVALSSVCVPFLRLRRR